MYPNRALLCARLSSLRVEYLGILDLIVDRSLRYAALVGLVVVLALGSAAGPASVTTKCQRFGQRLNAIRTYDCRYASQRRLFAIHGSLWTG